MRRPVSISPARSLAAHAIRRARYGLDSGALRVSSRREKGGPFSLRCGADKSLILVFTRTHLAGFSHCRKWLRAGEIETGL